MSYYISFRRKHTYFCIQIRIILFSETLLAENKPPEGEPQPSTRGSEASNHPVWRHPITLRSLVVRSAVVEHFFGYLFTKKSLGGSGMVLGVPRTPYKLFMFPENLIFVNILFVWSIVLLIGVAY